MDNITLTDEEKINYDLLRKAQLSMGNNSGIQVNKPFDIEYLWIFSGLRFEA